MKQVILLHTNKHSNTIIEKYNKLQQEVGHIADVVILYHKLEEIPENIQRCNHFTFTFDVLYELGYRPVNNEMMYHSEHFPRFKFWRSHPEYDFYWVVEDDVEFTGNWQNFFGELTEFNHDLLAADIRKANSAWFWYTTYTDWHPTETLDKTKMLACFNPISRLSNDAMKSLDRKFLDGWKMIHEISFPTFLGPNNIADFGGLGEFVPIGFLNRFYEYSTHRFRPIFDNWEQLKKPNKLYHPFKPSEEFQDNSSIY